MSLRSVLCKGLAGFTLIMIASGSMASAFAAQEEEKHARSDVKQESFSSASSKKQDTIRAVSIEDSKAREFAKLAPTTLMTFEELVGDNGDYEEPTAYPAPDTFHVIVDITHQVVLVYKKDAAGAYTVPVRYMVCSTGASKTPSPRGVFATGKHKVRYGLFVNDGVYGQYWTNVTRRIYFHSLLYTKKNAKTYTTSSYNNLGKRASHGCIRLLVPDARFLYYHLAPGSTVEIRKGSKDDIYTAKIKEQLIRPALPKERPDLVKGEIPNTDNWRIDTYLQQYPHIVAVE